MPESFNEQYALSYERHSAKRTRMYQTAIDALLRVDGGIIPGERILDIGSGTLNSTIYIARSAPYVGKVIGMEPSGLMKLAKYKLDRGPFPFSGSQPGFEEALEYIEEQRIHGMRHESKIDLVQGRVPGIPFSDETFNRAYMCQVIHWLAFTDEVTPANFDHLAKGLQDISRSLKPDGKLFFDSNGHIFDYTGLPQGQKINDMHYVNHPLYKSFDDNFKGFVTNEGFSVDETQEKTPDRLRFLFNINNLQAILDQAGLKLIDGYKDNNHLLTLVPFPTQRIAASILDTAKMHHFRHPGLTELPNEDRDRIITEVMDQTLKSSPDNGTQYRETFISFAAQKAV